MLSAPPGAWKGFACLAILATSCFVPAQTAVSNAVNYRGQPQADLTCTQTLYVPDPKGKDRFLVRNDPSTNCFGFPTIQFDTLPVEGGKPNGLTIDWSLMVDELQMQDDDRLHIHLPGFTGAHNTFGIMGPAINSDVKGMQYAPNMKSEKVTDDAETTDAQRADFGALVGIWGISCGTEGNLYMDRAKVDNIRTAEWDPTRETLRVVIKGRRYGPTTGRHDGYVGSNNGNHGMFDGSSAAKSPWAKTGADQGKAIPFSETTEEKYDKPWDNSKSTRGHHLQAMEYSREGPSGVVSEQFTGSAVAVGGLVNGGGSTGTAPNFKAFDAATDKGFKGFFLNDGYVMAPGNRVCGIYIDPTKLHRGQVAKNDPNGLGPLPPYGGIGKNWYKLAYIRRFTAKSCVGGASQDGVVVRPGMSPEGCTIDKRKDVKALDNFWQVPFDGDSERVVGYQYATTKQTLPVAAGSQPYGTLQAPTFSFAQAKGKTNGPSRDNCITVSLISSVTMVSGTSASQITIKGFKGTPTSDTDTLQLFADDSCTTSYKDFAGVDGKPIQSFRPVTGTNAMSKPDDLLHNYRPVGAMAFDKSGKPIMDFSTIAGLKDKYLDDVDWHTRARMGTTSALTVGSVTIGKSGTDHKSDLRAKGPMIASKLSSPLGDLATANAAAKFSKADGTVTFGITPGYYLQAGELLVVSFKLQNPQEPQDSQPLTVSASGTYCDSSNLFCSGAADIKLDIQDVPITDKGKVLESKPAYFSTSKIFQASSDPDSLTTIFVTLKPNVDLKKPDSTADARLTISGLCGFQTGVNVQLYQNQKAGGLPLNNQYPIEAVRSMQDLPDLSQDDIKHVDPNADWDASSGTLKIKIGSSGFLAETTYAFAFQLQTGKEAHDACVPKISSSGGSETIAEQDFSSAVNVGMTMPPQFTTIKIGQVTTRPDVTNFLCVTLQHNYEFYSDAVVVQNAQKTGNYIESKITISGLTGTQAVSTVANGKGIALTYCPTDLIYFDDKTTQHTSTQFQLEITSFPPRRYKTWNDNCFGTSAATQRCVPGNPYVPDDAFDTTVAGRSWFGGQSGDKDTFTWDQETGTAVLTVDPEITKDRKTNPQTLVGGIPKNAQIVFALPLQNSKTASDCKEVTFEASGRITQKAVFVQTKTGRALQDGENDGDACALKVYAPGFLVKKITQSSASTDDDNVITVSLRANVDFASVASGQASTITISGLTGTATNLADLGISAQKWSFSPRFESGKGKWTQSTGTLELKLDAGACYPPTVWAAGDYYDLASGSKKDAPFAVGGADAAPLILKEDVDGTNAKVVDPGSNPKRIEGLLGTPQPSVCIKAGFLYVFSFAVQNPGTEQPAPNVQISGKFRDFNNNEIVVEPQAIDAPISGDEDKIPLRISDQILTTAKIGQLVPAPSAMNLICVTLQSSKDIKSTTSAPLSSITITGLTGYSTDEQDLILYENDGVTAVSDKTGNPKNNPYQVGTIFTGSNTQNRNSLAPGFVRYMGREAGEVRMWIREDTLSADGKTITYMQKGVDHKFCFIVKNPDTPMECKDVSVIVNNKGKISTVKAEQDMSTTIEYYPYGSACAGYVASPGFVVSNFRSSSNTTGSGGSGTSSIHIELATNILLKAGDKFTISGLTSYTKSCPTPPCNIGIDVTKMTASRVFGKLYVNGRRSVIPGSTGDGSATADDRKKFAMEIQTYDLSAAKDDGTYMSTFGETAAWGNLGDTQESASTLTFTIATGVEMQPADITASRDPALYEIFLTLNNKPTPVDNPEIMINIGQGQTQYPKQAMNIGQNQPKMGISKVGDGGMEITYTPSKTIYGGESLILTLPRFTRDTNGMLFGVTSFPNNAFETYSNWQDWKAYGINKHYARAFFTNGWYADGISAKSGDSGQTGERWNYPNVNAKVTTDADFNHDTGIFVLDSQDPGVGVNKNYWYANTEENVYEGRVTRVANYGPAAKGDIPGKILTEGTTDYFLDNGEALVPIASADMIHYEALMKGSSKKKLATTAPDVWAAPVEQADTGFAFSKLGTVADPFTTATNGYRRPHLVIEALAASAGDFTPDVKTTRNNIPGLKPKDAYRGKSKVKNTPEDNFEGTPPFKGIPAKFQPSKRDNFYRGMLMKCWIGTSNLGGKTDYSEFADDVGTALTKSTGMYRKPDTNVLELLPPPERMPASPSFEEVDETDFIVDASITNAKIMEKAGVSRVLETRVIQASFRQIDYIPRKAGGCHWSGLDTIDDVKNGPEGGKYGEVGCQDEVPGYPAVVRLESPFSRTLDPDTLCYIQRKADVGVYTGMTAMIGHQEYTLKQGAANLYTVSHKKMVNANGDPVDRKVPRSYSAEDGGMNYAKGLRGSANLYGFFKDGSGLSGQPYLIYSQLEVVARKGAKVSIGETITIKIPSSSAIMPPTDMTALITPANDKDTIADKVKISHALLVPLSSACSVVSVYGVQSGCQYDNKRGGSFDLILSTQWPYAYDRENENDINGYGMTVFGAQSTVIKTMADKYSQDLPLKPLEGASDATGKKAAPEIFDLTKQITQAAETGRLQKSTAIEGEATATKKNSVIDKTLTVAAELDTLTLTTGTARADKLPKLPNAPVTLTHAGCGTLLSDSLGPATLPYAVCLTLGGSLAHNQFLTKDNDIEKMRAGAVVAAALTNVAQDVDKKNINPPVVNQNGVVVAGVQSITGEIGQDITPVVPRKFAGNPLGAAAPAKYATTDFGSARPDYATTADGTAVGNAKNPYAVIGSMPGATENPADNLGLGSFIIVGVYNQGASDRFVWEREQYKGTGTTSALPSRTDMFVNRVVQRYLGTSRQTIALKDIPSGLIGGNRKLQPAAGYPAPAGETPVYQARVFGGYSVGRFAFGQSKIMQVRADATSNAHPMGVLVSAADADKDKVGSVYQPVTALSAVAAPFDHKTANAIPTGLPVSVGSDDTAGVANDNHFSGFPAETSTPTYIEQLFFGRSTLPLPQVIHTAKDTSKATVPARLTRGHCGQVGSGPGVKPTDPAKAPQIEDVPGKLPADETCATYKAEFNDDLPFSRNVYIEQGHDVFLISSLFDTLIQRPEPARTHLSIDFTAPTTAKWVTIEGNDVEEFAGYFASDSAATPVPWPGVADDSANVPRTPFLRPRKDGLTKKTRYGTIQTQGTVPKKSNDKDGNKANNGGDKDEKNQYGFDQDFRLYSVLGPFMGPARIKDVWDSAKIPSAYTSNFPGVLTIHSGLKTLEAEAPKTKIQENIQNNALYHLAPVVGTTYAKAADRFHQYHIYDTREADKIISFCSPLISDLNNAPGVVLNNDISDDPVNAKGVLPKPPVTGDAPKLTSDIVNPKTGFKFSLGSQDKAPTQWTVPRRHHLCRKLLSGSPDLTVEGIKADPHYSAADKGGDAKPLNFARFRYTESMQMNTVLNQEPSPNMRAMVTFVEPTTISVSFGGGEPCDVESPFNKDSKFDAKCTEVTIRGETTSVTIPVPIPDWFEISFEEFKNEALNFTADEYPELQKNAKGKRGIDVYDKPMCLGDFANITVPAQNSNADEKDAVTYTVKQTTTLDMDLKGLDKRRRLLATCADGFEARMIIIGKAIKSACSCPSACGLEQASCQSKASGLWNTITLNKRVCASSNYDPTGAIVGGVIGGFFGLLLLLLIAWYFCCRKEKELVGRPVPMEKPLAPVYLPQPYPALPEQYAPAPMPAYPIAIEGVVQPTGQPTLYSSYQAVPVPAFAPVETYPPSVIMTAPGGYPAPYGVVPQPAYGA